MNRDMEVDMEGFMVVYSFFGQEDEYEHNQP